MDGERARADVGERSSERIGCGETKGMDEGVPFFFGNAVSVLGALLCGLFFYGSRDIHDPRVWPDGTTGPCESQLMATA